MMRPLYTHPPVLVRELVRAVVRSPRYFAMSKAAKNAPGARLTVVDATLGGGTHTEALLEASPLIRVAAVDCDGGGVQRRAEVVQKKYGAARFKWFPSYRMSQLQTLFGPRSADALIIDPGPCFGQLSDPTRGFSLDAPDDASLFDMRYSPKIKSSALDVVNSATEEELWLCFTEIAMLPNRLARHAVQALMRRRPFRGLPDVMSALQLASPSMGEFAGDAWMSGNEHHSWGLVPPVVRMLFGLRAMVNNEPQELAEGIRAALEVLDYDGRLIVFTRLPFERDIVATIAESHPYALMCFETKISADEAREFSQSVVTRMHVLQRTEHPCFAIKNASLAEDEHAQRRAREEDHQKWLLAMDGLGTRYGFPARHFGSRATPMKHEFRAAEQNANPPSISVDRLADRNKRMPRH